MVTHLPEVFGRTSAGKGRQLTLLQSQELQQGSPVVKTVTGTIEELPFHF